MGNIGPGQLLLIALIVLLLFGAGRISEIGKGLGQGIRNFKKGLREDDPGDKELPEGGSTKNAKLPEKTQDS